VCERRNNDVRESITGRRESVNNSFRITTGGTERTMDRKEREDNKTQRVRERRNECPSSLLWILMALSPLSDPVSEMHFPLPDPPLHKYTSYMYTH